MMIMTTMMKMMMVVMVLVINYNDNGVSYSQEKGCSRYVGWSIRAVSKLQVANG